jgi:hypothetical protein
MDRAAKPGPLSGEQPSFSKIVIGGLPKTSIDSATIIKGNRDGHHGAMGRRVFDRRRRS